MSNQNISLSLVAGLMAVFAIGCSEERTSTASEPLPDAEAPYAEPVVTPPAVTAHAQTRAPETQKLDLKTAATAPALREDTDQIDTAIVTNHVNSKVDNVVKNTANSAKNALKDVALNSGDAALKSAVETGEALSPFTSLVGDVERGTKLYSQCAVCHSKEAGKNFVGPSLYNIVGRQAGVVEGFKYSKANGSGDFVWTEDALFAFIENPQSYLPGTRMAFSGVRDEQKRADIVAYLKTLSE